MNRPLSVYPLLCLISLVLVASPYSSDAAPAYGLNSLPTNRPISIGYLNALRNATGQATSYSPSEIVTEIDGLNWSGYDAVVHAFAEPVADGTIGEGLGNFAAYQSALLSSAHAHGKSVIMSIGGAFPARLANQFSTIAASSSLRQTFSQNIVSYLQAHGYDGVDIDWEFPDVRGNMTLLMQDIYAAVKAANSNYIVMFATGPGYWLGSYDFSALNSNTDLYFYFGYDWKNPANGPMTNPGSIQYTSAGDQLPEASVRGGIQYVLNQGFPAAKIICGLPFYGSQDTSWSAVRNTWAADQAGYLAAIIATYMEVEINSEYFTSPDCIKKKMEAVLKPSATVLNNQVILRGIGCWEIGHEYRLNPDLSTAFAQWLAAYPGISPGPSIVRQPATGGGTQAQLSFTGFSNTTYHVQYAGSLTSPITWMTMPSPVTSNGQGQFQVVDPPTLPPQRYYRAVYP